MILEESRDRERNVNRENAANRESCASAAAQLIPTPASSRAAHIAPSQKGRRGQVHFRGWGRLFVDKRGPALGSILGFRCTAS
jgi:hypothetical protein